MTRRRYILIRSLILSGMLFAAVFAAKAASEPNIGYIYPAGAQQGTLSYVLIGGQLLRKPEAVYISGSGVSASIDRYLRPRRNLKHEQRIRLTELLEQTRNKRLVELGYTPKINSKKAKKKKPMTKEEAEEFEREAKLQPHPLFDNLENKSIRELAHVYEEFFNRKWRRQYNGQLADLLVLKVKVEPDAKIGNYELRVKTASGLSKPVIFQVGSHPEVKELEPNDLNAWQRVRRVPVRLKLPEDKAHELPVVLNGQIRPGDIDRFRFRAAKGQKLVFAVSARELIPYLADAVPGWFQAVLTLYDAKGNELAFADDYRFNPDPVMFYEVPQSGEYELAIRDSIYRGREDFVYRITISEDPFINWMFLLGGRLGTNTITAVGGWNLPVDELKLDTASTGVHTIGLEDGKKYSNSVLYAVDTLPESTEYEKNETLPEAQKITLPRIINGHIDKASDIDIYSFEGNKGDKIVAEVTARRLNSPLDSLLYLKDSEGKVIAMNDDYVLEDEHLYKNASGLSTHHADSYICTELPADGRYYISIADTQNHGGIEYAYRLRISHPVGDFALRSVPSTLTLRPGAAAPVKLYVLRKDGFTGPVKISIEGNDGFLLSGGEIPAGICSGVMTITAPDKGSDTPFTVKLSGSAEVGGKTLRRPAVPADDVMQAFLYRHLVPAQQFMVYVRNLKWKLPSFNVNAKLPVQIPAGGTVKLPISIRSNQKFRSSLRLKLDNPPKGISIQNCEATDQGLELTLKADAKAQKNKIENLLIEVFREYTPKKPKNKPQGPNRRYPVGFVPAFPVKIIAPATGGKK